MLHVLQIKFTILIRRNICEMALLHRVIKNFRTHVLYLHVLFLGLKQLVLFDNN